MDDRKRVVALILELQQMHAIIAQRTKRLLNLPTVVAITDT